MACKKGVVFHKWTTEEIEFLRTNYQLYDINQLVPLFNENFGLNLSKNSIKATLQRLKIHCGRSGQWQKGQTPYNKGMKWDDYMTKEGQAKSRKTCFSKKDRSINNSNHNEVPIGTELISKDGYILVKIDNPTGTKARRWWRYKHHLIYEQHYGPIPKGYNVIFADGNKRNFDVDNLVLVSDNELFQMNKHNLYYRGCADATKCGVLIAKIKIKQSEVKKNGD